MWVCFSLGGSEEYKSEIETSRVLSIGLVRFSQF